MREILFSGKRVDNGDWVCGDLSYHTNDRKACYIFPGSGCDSPDSYEVNPATVVQFTGMYDANRSKIFEGDVIKTTRYEKFIDFWIVKFDAGAFYFVGKDFCLSPNMFDCDYSEFSEVIGNVFDNPELLQKFSE